MKKVAVLTTLMMLNFASLPQSFANTSLLKDTKINDSIHAVLKQVYGTNFEPSKQCYHFTEDYMPVCVGIMDLQKRIINNQPYLFVMTNGDSLNESAGHPEGGISGLFVFKNSDNHWKLIAKDPKISNGQWGESQLKNFKLVKIGSEKYGWAGTYDGSGAGGESNSTWTLYAPIGDKILPIIEEETAHNYTGGHWLETKGNVSILTNRPEINGYYPIQVTRTTQTALTADNGDPIKSKIKTKKENYTRVLNGERFVKIKSLTR